MVQPNCKSIYAYKYIKAQAEANGQYNVLEFPDHVSKTTGYNFFLTMDLRASGLGKYNQPLIHDNYLYVIDPNLFFAIDVDDRESDLRSCVDKCFCYWRPVRHVGHRQQPVTPVIVRFCVRHTGVFRFHEILQDFAVAPSFGKYSIMNSTTNYRYKALIFYPYCPFPPNRRNLSYCLEYISCNSTCCFHP